MRVALGLVLDTGDFPVEFENSLFTNHMYHILPYIEKVWRDKNTGEEGNLNQLEGKISGNELHVYTAKIDTKNSICQFFAFQSFLMHTK